MAKSKDVLAYEARLAKEAAVKKSPKKAAAKPAGRSLVKRMKDRTKDLDAAVDGKRKK